MLKLLLHADHAHALRPRARRRELRKGSRERSRPSQREPVQEVREVAFRVSEEVPAACEQGGSGWSAQSRGAAPEAEADHRQARTNSAKTQYIVTETCEKPKSPHENESRLGDLNPGPTHYECVALPQGFPRHSHE